MMISVKNQIAGTVISVSLGAGIAMITIDIGSGNIITSKVSSGAATELDLKKGDRIMAIIKESDILLAK